MKSNIAFVWSTLSVMLFLHAVVSLGCCINQAGWHWYASLLLSVGAFFYFVQMWNSAAYPNSR